MEPISVTTPISQAWERMVRILFQPFDVKKWFVLGFCAFLASLGEGGTNFNSNSFNQDRGGGGNFPDIESEIFPWIESHLGLVVMIALAFLLFVVVLMAVFGWLQARGTFMFIDGIAKNRGAVKEPWRLFRSLGNSLFVVKFFLGLVTFLVIMALAALALVMLWPVIESGGDGFDAALPVIVLSGVVTTVMILVVVMISFVIEDLIVPAMYANDATIGEAWGIVKSDLLPGNFSVLILYVLMKFVLGIGVAIVAVLAILLTCCIAALPYIGSVILLPLSVFMQGYNLYFVQQFGERFRVFRFEDEAFDDDLGPLGGGDAGGDDPYPYKNL